MKKILFAGLFIALTTNAVKSAAQSLAEKLSGEWTITEIALDMNGDKKMDKNESIKANCIGLYMNLNSNGSGTARMDIFSAREDRLKWSLGNNNTEINFSGDDNADKKLLCYKISDSRNTMHIDKLSGNNLQLSSEDGGIMMWISLKKK